ncbi:MAG TPA: 3-deoxy-manno-octulosonate cytidylyltransferase [Gemmatimonadaceae bacterium]|nr:3-deoxy-manno-octulosonate cytidylyltransferase [Gemmatimonadaceae bacterium]
MTTLAVIPARLGAERLPNKPLRTLGGVPLVVRVWERVTSLDVADHVVVATDAPEVVRACAEHDVHAVLTSADHPSGTDRVAEVARLPEFRSADVIVNVQGDEPFITRDAVAGAAALVADGRFPIGTVASPLDASAGDAPHVVKVVCADDGRALYFSRASVPFLRDAADRPLRDATARHHVGVYAYTPDALARWVALPVHPLERIERLEQLRPLAAGIAIGVAMVDRLPAHGVDTEDDLAAANARWTALSAGWS